ncbi:MAG: PAS domain S-box protein [Bacteroidota bacterium]
MKTTHFPILGHETTVMNDNPLQEQEPNPASAPDLSRFYSLFMQSPAFIAVIKGPDHTFELANHLYLQHIGKTDIIGKTIIEVLPEIREQGFIQLLDQAYQSGKPYAGNEVLVKLDKKGTGELEEVFVNFVYQPIFDGSGNTEGIFIHGVDISTQVISRKIVEEQNKVLERITSESNRKERLYEAITGSTPDLIYIFSLDHRFIYANEALLTMWGQTWEYSNGRGLRELGYEDWHAAMHEREIDEITVTKKPVRGTVSFPHAVLGKRIYDYILVPVFNTAGEVEAVAGTTRDITDITRAEDALKESESRFRQLAEAMPQLVWTALADGKADYFNHHWYEYTGLSTDESTGDDWISIIHPSDREAATAAWAEGLENGEQVTSSVRLQNRNKEYNWFLVRAIPQRGQDGLVEKWFGTFTDFNEQKILSEQLEELVVERTRELHRSNEDLQQFAHVASHDLKEPVRKIRTFANLLETRFRESLPEKGQEYLDKIQVATNRINDMIEGVLNYSSLESAEDSTPDEINLKAVINHIKNDLELIIQQKNAGIEVDELPVIRGKYTQIYQLFYNLVNNSLKFSRDGRPPIITISGKVTDRGSKNGVEITLNDNGIGFDNTYSEKIFGSFTRLHSKDDYEGTGLGLALCKKIAQQHGGTITASGKVNQGASFVLFLPF